MISDLCHQLAHALRNYGGCVCVRDYDMKVIGEPCPKCSALEAYNLAVEKEKKRE